MDRLAEEVNDKLQEKGHVTIPELTKVYDLPADFLTKVCQNISLITVNYFESAFHGLAIFEYYL